MAMCVSNPGDSVPIVSPTIYACRKKTQCLQQELKFPTVFAIVSDIQVQQEITPVSMFEYISPLTVDSGIHKLSNSTLV